MVPGGTREQSCPEVSGRTCTRRKLLPGPSESTNFGRFAPEGVLWSLLSRMPGAFAHGLKRQIDPVTTGVRAARARLTNSRLGRDPLRDALLSPLAQELMDPLVRQSEESANVALAEACLL